MLHFIYVAKANGSALGSISPTENINTAVNTQKVMNPPISITNNIGTRKTDGVLLMKSAVHLTIDTPSLILLHMHNIISRYNPAIPHNI